MMEEEGSILLVDDTPENLNILMQILRYDGYEIHSTTRGDKALTLLESMTPDLFLLDINMPGMSGFELCREIKKIENLKSTPVIFISALSETKDKVQGFELGGVDYITKPYHTQEVRARVRTHIRNRKMSQALEVYNRDLESMVARQVKEIRDSQIATIFALAKLAESRDDDTGKHLERVQNYCRILAETLAWKSDYSRDISSEFIEDLFNASPLHDIGKVGLPDRILLKGGKLTSEEFEIMKTHTTLGSKNLEAVQEQYPHNHFIRMGIDVARSHHESWDGSGYPQGLAGRDIPLSARIMSIADVYDALRSRRCYKDAFSHEETYRIITEEMSFKFDPEIIRVFQTIEEEFSETYDKHL